MRKVVFFLALIIICFQALVAFAQSQSLPDYAIRNIRSRLADDGTQVTIAFEVQNNGANATDSSTAELLMTTGGQAIADEEVAPLAANEIVTITFDVPFSRFSASESVPLTARVGIGEIEPNGSRTTEDNIAYITVAVPAGAQSAPPNQLPDAGAGTPVPNEPTAEATPSPSKIISLPWGGTLDLGSISLPADNLIYIPIIIAACGAALILLWVITIILRLIFRQPEVFDVWHPPYAGVPPHDPNSLVGRRRLWQEAAQSDSMIAPCIPGQYHVVKQLIGNDGKKLSGWRIHAIRLSQYDVYGRVARSQTLAPKGNMRRLDKLAHKKTLPSLNDVERAAQPIARQLAQAFTKKLNKRSAMLPVALDLRFRGAHGEARIRFQIFQCMDGAFQKVDEWDPEMNIAGNHIQENYTYTFHGQKPDERTKEYRTRLTQEIAHCLSLMLPKQEAQPPMPTPPTSPSIEQVTPPPLEQTQAVQATTPNTPIS
jgi:CARDB